MLRIEMPEPTPSEAGDFGIAFHSESELDAMWSDMLTLLEEWANDGFDGRLDFFGDRSEGFRSNVVTTRRAGSTVGVYADLGTHAAGGYLALIDRMTRLFEQRRVDGILTLGDPFAEATEVLPIPSYVDVTAQDLERLRAVGAGHVDVEVVGRLAIGIQSFELHASSQPAVNAPWLNATLDRWYQDCVVPRLEFAPSRRQMRVIPATGFLFVDVTVQRDPIVLFTQLLVMLSDAPPAVGRVGLRLLEAGMLLPCFD